MYTEQTPKVSQRCHRRQTHARGYKIRQALSSNKSLRKSPATRSNPVSGQKCPQQLHTTYQITLHENRQLSRSINHSVRSESKHTYVERERPVYTNNGSANQERIFLSSRAVIFFERSAFLLDHTQTEHKDRTKDIKWTDSSRLWR